MMTTTMVQIRNVPVEFHRRLKARAAIEGMSMSDFILREVGKSLDRPSRSDVLARIRERKTGKLPLDVARLLREGRDAR
jgi:plasmid stability protein